MSSSILEPKIEVLEGYNGHIFLFFGCGENMTPKNINLEGHELIKLSMFNGLNRVKALKGKDAKKHLGLRLKEKGWDFILYPNPHVYFGKMI